MAPPIAKHTGTAMMPNTKNFSSGCSLRFLIAIAIETRTTGWMM
jgi:hypothetical protein